MTTKGCGRCDVIFVHEKEKDVTAMNVKIIIHIT